MSTTNTNCDGYGRRDFLQVGLGTAAAGLGLSQIMSLRAQAAQRAGKASPDEVRCILVWLDGGPTHHESFDPKPDAAKEVRGEFKPIRTRLPGVQFSEIVPKLAAINDKFTVVRSICHKDPNHGGASITDASGNLLDNDPAILDDTTITVTADVTPPTLAPSDIVDDQGGGAVLAGTLVTYTVSFSKDMDDSTVGADDFGNAGTAAVLFGSVAETAPGVFSVEVTPTLAGSLQLQVLMGAELSDAAGNPLDTGAAIADDNTIVVSEPTGGTSVVTVAEVFAHNEQDNFGQGFVMDMLNGSGMNGNGNDDVPGWPAVGGDPSMWVATSNAWQAEWQSRDLLGDGDEGEDLPTNGKIGWVIYDLGEATADLDSLYIWNQRENAGRYTASFNVYTATSPAVAPVHGPTNSSSIDYDFSSGGWTIVNPGAPLSGTYQGEQVVLLGGRTARYVAIEILANNGDANRVGLAEIAVTAGNLGGGGDDFSDWIAMFPGVGSETGIGDDPDGDGVESGVENFFGTAPDVFTQGLIATSGSGDTFTFTHPQGTLADDLTAIYRWSTDLQSFYAGGSAAPSGLRVDFSVTPDSPNPGTTTVTATISGGETGRLFVDVEVTQ